MAFFSHAQCNHPACVTCSMQPAKFHLYTEHTYLTGRSNNQGSSGNGVPEVLEVLEAWCGSKTTITASALAYTATTMPNCSLSQLCCVLQQSTAIRFGTNSSLVRTERRDDEECSKISSLQLTTKPANGKERETRKQPHQPS
jgi:hypothetical protein